MIKVHGLYSILMGPVEFRLKIKAAIALNRLHSTKEANKGRSKSNIQKQVVCQLNENRAALSMRVIKQTVLIVSY